MKHAPLLKSVVFIKPGPLKLPVWLKSMADSIGVTIYPNNISSATSEEEEDDEDSDYGYME
jgi:hypothetical protein